MSLSVLAVSVLVILSAQTALTSINVSDGVKEENKVTVDLIPLNKYLWEHQRSPIASLLDLTDGSNNLTYRLDEVCNDADEPLNPHDFNRAENRHSSAPQLGPDHLDPIEIANQFEGDILISPRDTFSQHDSAADDNQLWPNAVIPYIIATGFTLQERATIAQAVKTFEDHTCIRVVPKQPGDSSGSYVHVVKGVGCSSAVGRQGGPQTLTLGSGCIYKGVVVHEFMHAAGFWHEQSRPDRNDHVLIHWDNIQRGMESNFRKFSGHEAAILDQPYDIGSVMHYGKYAFATDRRRPTISAIVGDESQMGQRLGLSRLDIVKLNSLYQCRAVTVTKPPTLPPVSPTGLSCRDSNENCEWWASRGECARNPTYMLVGCRQACRRCTDGQCRDLNRRCQAWSLHGECDKNPSYMLVYCRASCRLCQPACRDTNQLCPFWASSGECRQNPAYMLVACRRACQQC